jgi:hypothetical protein
MKDSKKQSKSISNDIPDDPCKLCLVIACCQDPCPLLVNYMGVVYNLADSDPNHPILDRFPDDLKESILLFVKKREEVRNNQIERILDDD